MLIAQMEFRSLKFVPIVLLFLLSNLRPAVGIRFVFDREECFSHSVPYEGDTVHVSFVVIKADTWHYYREDGVDLVVCFSLFVLSSKLFRTSRGFLLSLSYLTKKFEFLNHKLNSIYSSILKEINCNKLFRTHTP